ncbi:hypothetical protein HYU13_02650 [Candidatus Woesearchaeota archaeon]|nr:hypothetical protein [Candidatus Woesearchaeota archaeon]
MKQKKVVLFSSGVNFFKVYPRKKNPTQAAGGRIQRSGLRTKGGHTAGLLTIPERSEGSSEVGVFRGEAQPNNKIKMALVSIDF